jgi:hypothetical protein
MASFDYEQQLKMLSSMGFTDRSKNLDSLMKAKGKINEAIGYLSGESERGESSTESNTERNTERNSERDTERERNNMINLKTELNNRLDNDPFSDAFKI